MVPAHRPATGSEAVRIRVMDPFWAGGRIERGAAPGSTCGLPSAVVPHQDALCHYGTDLLEGRGVAQRVSVHYDGIRVGTADKASGIPTPAEQRGGIDRCRSQGLQ